MFDSLALCVLYGGLWYRANNWWERSPNVSNATNFYNVNNNGNPSNNNNANNTNGVVVGFSERK
jgi:hypothetical protein